MLISIKSPLYLHEVGRRSNNEDSIYPLPTVANEQDRLFVVCDGVGGSEKGEVASSLVCNLVPEFLANHPTQLIDKTFLEEMLSFIEQRLSSHVNANPQCKGMATTLTMLYFDERGATVAWCGDSRVYHFRGGEILFQTQDHSLVAEMVRRGELAEEEAESHPQKNVILRAISGADKPSKLDFDLLTDIQQGDRFLLCSDGVLEAFNSKELSVLNSNGMIDLYDMRDAIAIRCAERSRDNHAMYLLEVADVSGIAASTTGQHDTMPIQMPKEKVPTQKSVQQKEPGPNKMPAKEVSLSNESTEAKPKTSGNSNKAVLGLMGAALILTLTIGGLKMSELSSTSRYHEFLAMGNEQMERKQWNEAKISFQNAIEINPEDERAFDRLAEIRDRERQEFVEDSVAKAKQLLQVQDSLSFHASDSLHLDSMNLRDSKLDSTAFE